MSLTSFPHAVCNLNHAMVKFGNSELSSDKEGTGKDASHRVGGGAAGWYQARAGFPKMDTHLASDTHLGGHPTDGTEDAGAQQRESEPCRN